jgi:hypothetical protein
MKKLNLLLIAFALLCFVAFYNCQGTSQKGGEAEEPAEEMVEEAAMEADSMAMEEEAMEEDSMAMEEEGTMEMEEEAMEE